MGRTADFVTSLIVDLHFVSILVRIKWSIWRIQYFSSGFFSIVDLWERCVHKYGDNTYLIGPDYRYTYRECENMASSFAARFLLENLSSVGARVAFVGENSPGVVLRIIGLLKLAVIPVILRPSLNEDQLAVFLRGYSGLRVLYGTRQGLLSIPDSIKNLFPKTVEIPAPANDLMVSSALPAPLPKRRVRLEDEAFHVGTSGSGGYSKSVAVHHGALLAFALAHKTMKGLRESDVLYGLASISHGDGLAIGVVAPWTVGAGLYLDPNFSVEDFVDICVKNSISVLSHIGTLPRKLTRLPSSQNEASLKIRVSNGHEMLPSVWKGFQERFGVERIVEYYASSEGTILFMNKWKFGAAGFIGPLSRLLYPFEIVKVDDGGHLETRGNEPVRCGYGEVGEALGLLDPTDPLQQMNTYTDESLFQGRVIKSVFRQGDAWYRTGDLLRRERDGFIHFVGRMKLTVKIDGAYVSYPHVEDKILSAQPSGFQIDDCYVTSVKAGAGRPLRLLGYLRIVAGEFSGIELHKYLTTVLDSREIPTYIILRQEPFRYTDSHRLYRNIPEIDHDRMESLLAKGEAYECQSSGTYRARRG